jgi:hypothetical protein
MAWIQLPMAIFQHDYQSSDGLDALLDPVQRVQILSAMELLGERYCGAALTFGSIQRAVGAISRLGTPHEHHRPPEKLKTWIFRGQPSQTMLEDLDEASILDCIAQIVDLTLAQDEMTEFI